jgi:hypothetical protein
MSVIPLKADIVGASGVSDYWAKWTSSLVSTTRHDQLSDQGLHHFVSLIAREASYSGDPAIRPGPRGYNFQDLAFDLQDVAETGGLARRARLRRLRHRRLTVIPSRLTGAW